MGNCVSQQDREAQQRSQEIDKQIEEDSRKFKKECKILLLGTSPLISCRPSHPLLTPCLPPLSLSFPAFIASTGSGESGKSTIVKQMKIIHQNGYNKEELLTYRTTIYRNLLESAKNILLAMRKIGVDCQNPANRVCSLFAALSFFLFNLT